MKRPLDFYPPAPFCILIDSREQTPLPFPPSVPTRVVREGDGESLYPGDYSIEGLRNRFVIERKSLEDLVGTLVGKEIQKDGRRRYRKDKFVEELTAMRDIFWKCVIVTEPISKLEAHMYQSMIEPHNVAGMIAAIEAMTGVQFKFFESPAQCARWVAGEALHFWRREHGLSDFRVKLEPKRLERKRMKCPKPPKPQKKSNV